MNADASLAITIKCSPMLQNSSTGRILYRSGSLCPMPTRKAMITYRMRCTLKSATAGCLDSMSVG